MTPRELLALPTEHFEALNQSQLETLLGPLIPDSRRPDRENLAVKESKRLLSQTAAVMEAIRAEQAKSKPPVCPTSPTNQISSLTSPHSAPSGASASTSSRASKV